MCPAELSYMLKLGWDFQKFKTIKIYAMSILKGWGAVFNQDVVTNLQYTVHVSKNSFFLILHIYLANYARQLDTIGHN